MEVNALLRVMGQVFGGLWNTLTGSGCQSKIVILGLSNAGKTTILYKLALDSVVVTQPTIGSNVEELKKNSINLIDQETMQICDNRVVQQISNSNIVHDISGIINDFVRFTPGYSTRT